MLALTTKVAAVDPAADDIVRAAADTDAVLTPP
jgi:hypothetical protein